MRVRHNLIRCFEGDAGPAVVLYDKSDANGFAAPPRSVGRTAPPSRILADRVEPFSLADRKGLLMKNKLSLDTHNPLIATKEVLVSSVRRRPRAYGVTMAVLAATVAYTSPSAAQSPPLIQPSLTSYYDSKYQNIHIIYQMGAGGLLDIYCPISGASCGLTLLSNPASSGIPGATSSYFDGYRAAQHWPCPARRSSRL